MKKRTQTQSLKMKVSTLFHSPWRRFEQTPLWSRLTHRYCTDVYEREKDHETARRDPHAVTIFRIEAKLLLTILVCIAIPGITTPWIFAPLIFGFLVSHAIRSAIVNTFGGARMAFDTGGKVFGFMLFGGAIYGIAAVLSGFAIEWVKTAIYVA